MGWGQEPHEGWADEKLPDGSWLGPTRRGGDPDPVAYQAVCGCGWRSEREHSLPPRPADLPRDERGLPYGPEYEAWIAALEASENACWEDWDAEHYQSLLGYEPHTQLILGRTEGGLRHFLDGRPVHAGGMLELLLDDGRWIRVRYEWSWQPEVRPTANVALGVPDPPAIVDRRQLCPLSCRRGRFFAGRRRSGGEARVHPPRGVVEVNKGGRRMFGKVIEIRDGVVQFEPLCRGISYRHASAREIIGHWRKTGRRGPGPADEPDVPERGVVPRAQLALRIRYVAPARPRRRR